MTKPLLITAVLSLLPLIASSAESPCRKDRDTLCAGIEQGKGRVLKCLREHSSKLAPACREHLEAQKSELKEARSFCEDDVLEHCASVEKGEGRLLRCLKAHMIKGNLSADCATHLEEAHKQRKDRKSK